MEKLHEYIISCRKCALFKGGIRIPNLLKRSYIIMVKYDVESSLANKIRKIFQAETDEDVFNYDTSTDPLNIRENGEAYDLFFDEIDPAFNALSPEGYYFGVHVQDESLIGWFKDENI